MAPPSQQAMWFGSQDCPGQFPRDVAQAQPRPALPCPVLCGVLSGLAALEWRLLLSSVGAICAMCSVVKSSCHRSPLENRRRDLEASVLRDNRSFIVS